MPIRSVPARLPALLAARYAFRPKLLPTLAFLIALPLFIHLGFWQYGKAQRKEALQNLLESRRHQPPQFLGVAPVDAQTLRFKRVRLRGTYEPQRQILVDNRVYRERAGFHVITPFRLAGDSPDNMHILVNRGWLPMPADRRGLPNIDTPAGPLELSGTAVVPDERFFTLEAPPPVANGWQPIWQNLDLARFRASVPYPIQPVVVLLDADAAGDPATVQNGLVRDQPRPDESVAKNLGYAFQWFGFAVTLIAIYLIANLRRLQ